MASGKQKNSHLHRAVKLHDQGRLAEALSLYQAVLEDRHDDTRVMCLCARANREMGNLGAAGELMRRANRLAPDSVEVFSETGELAMATGDLNTADQVFRQLTEKYPNESRFWLARARVNERVGNWQSSITAYQRAISKFEDAEGRPMLGLARVLLQARDIVGAIDIYESEISSNPDHCGASLGLGAALTATGRFDEAEKIYRSITHSHPAVTEVWRLIAMIKTFDSIDDPDIVTMLELLEDKSLNPGMRANLHFALGKALDDCGSFRSAFSHFQQANEARRLLISPFDPKQHSGWIDRIIRVCDSPGECNSADDRCPIFVIGMPRSGTTLVERLLSNHPDVQGLGEVYFFSAITQTRLLGYPESTADLDDAKLKTLAGLYGDEACGLVEGQSVWTDKMPGNFLFVGLIRSVFPNARFVHVTRDPVDNAWSIYQQDFKSEQTYATNFSDIVSYFRDYRRLMDHWHSVYGDSIFTVSYEDLVNDPSTVMRKLLTDCGLSWNDACLSPAQNPQPVLTLSSWQARQPMTKRRIDSKEHYRDFIAPLFEGLTPNLDKRT